MVVFTGDVRASDRGALALTRELRRTGVKIRYLGREASPKRIAASAAAARADAIEVCVAAGGAVSLLRELLRELRRIDRHHISIVVHRVQ